jgi:xylulokinase
MYLGIDLGTSELKVLLLDEHQQVIAVAHEALSVSRPQPLWSEQNPQDWWIAMKSAVARLKQRHGSMLAAVKGIGLAGQMHGAVLLDRQDQVLRPAILWNDVRAGPQCARLEERFADCREITGNLAMPGFTAPKLLWVAEHEPDIFPSIAKILLPKDFLRLRLCDEHISEMSDAAGTLWLDVKKRDWSDAMLHACHLNRTQMPRLIEGCESGGVLCSSLARKWGMRGDVVIAGGAGDNAASAIGMGAIENGQAFISLGTSGVFFVANDQYKPNPAQGVHTFCHALPGRWHQMAVILSAASCLRWATHVTNAKNEGALLNEIASIDPIEIRRAPIFLPYLSGERTPHNDPRAQGVWFGLTHDTSRAALGYAVIEGVAFALLDGYRALQAAGTHVLTASVVGGGSKSRYWSELLASALQLPLSRHSGNDVSAALGAARLAMLATNPSVGAAKICTTPPNTDVIAPNPTIAEAMQPRFERFKKLYAALGAVFHS